MSERDALIAELNKTYRERDSLKQQLAQAQALIKKLERYEKALKESVELMFKHMQFAHQSDRQATETEWQMMALISQFDEQFQLGIRTREALKEGKARIGRFNFNRRGAS